ncbi:DUF3011 domain-containing protein [Luteitalea sp.]|jgi:Protein of unknown function (DUF3011)
MTRTPMLYIITSALLLAGATADAAGERLRCRSTDYRYNFCYSAQPIVRVTLRDKVSDRPCIQGRTWGYQRNGIWVDHGCDAEFEVESRYSAVPAPGYSGPGYPGGAGWYPDDGPGWDAPGEVPTWAIGSWRSDAPVGGNASTITVYPTGSATWAYGRVSVNGYWFGADEIRLYNNRVITFDRRQGRVQVALPGFGIQRFRRTY